MHAINADITMSFLLVSFSSKTADVSELNSMTMHVISIILQKGDCSAHK